MRTKQIHLSAISTARPLRVTYLVDLDDCPPALLDEVFAECYSRWAGRRTLVVPATSTGIDQRYDEWLWYFDPDIIYSFVSLTDAAVAAVHERYAPAFLTHHSERGISTCEQRSFRIELPITGLSSLSVLPAYGGRSWGFPDRPSKIEVLDKFWDASSAPFVQENFGFLRNSLGNAANSATQYPDIFTCGTLITKESLENKHYLKDPHARFFTDESSILDAIGRGLLTVAQLSEFFARYLGTGHHGAYGTTIVAGDEPDDRLLFWNCHHHYGEPLFGTLTAIRVPSNRLTDAVLLAQIREILRRRGAFGANGRADQIRLRSTSVRKEVLEAAAELLRKIGPPSL